MLRLLAVALLLAIAVAGLQTCRLHDARAEIARLAPFEAAQASQLDTIEQLRARLAKLTEERRFERGRLVAAVTAAEARAQAAQDALRTRRDSRETIYASDPDARAWRAAGVPVELLRSLPDHAGRSH